MNEPLEPALAVGGDRRLALWPRLKPFVAAGMLLAALWLGLSLAAPQPVQAAPDALACPVGTEQSGALCYPPCSEGYYGDGPLCVQRCPAGYTDDGAFCRKDAQIVAKQSYTRGAGSPLVCASNQEGQGGLCYPRCAGGYYGVGPVCWQFCKPGYADHGATCFRNIFDFYFKATYGRGAGGPASACPAGLERSGSLCYPRCAAGYYGVAASCFQYCPAGFRDDGAVCRKDAIIFAKATSGRGAGIVMNTVPVANDATLTTPKNTPVDVVFTHEDLDGEGGLPTTIVQRPSQGTYDGERYIPNQNFEGEDRILWKTNDGKNDSNVAIITILVGNVGANSAPVAVDRTVAVAEDTPITITVTCTDAEGDDLLYQLVEAPRSGEYQWLPPNQVVYTPTLDFVGVDQFRFRSHDGQAVSNVSVVTLAVGAVNDPPAAQTQQLTTPRNGNLGIALLAVDVEGEPITYTVVASPTNGVLSGVAPDLIYVPNDDFVGGDSFVFRAADSQGAFSEATISIDVHANNNAPVAAALAYTTSQETPVTINLAVDAAAQDADGDALAYSLVTAPANGLLEGEGDGYIYTPAAGFAGQDSFVYRASDGAASAEATVSVQVLPAPAQGVVAGFVYEDEDKDGRPTQGEKGVENLLVSLTPAGMMASAEGAAAGSLTTLTDSYGAWRLEGAPFGDYTLTVADGSAVKIAQPFTATLTVSERGTTLAPFAAVDVTWRGLYLPSIAKD